MNIRFIIYGILAGALLITGAYYKGVWDEHEKYETAAKSVRAQDVAIARAMQPRLARTITEIQTVTHTNTMRIPYAVSHIVYRDRVVARPVYYFTRADVLCWNSSLHVPGASPCPDQTTAGADAFAVTGTSLADAFANLNDNGGTCAEYAAVARGWQEYWAKISKVKP